MAFGGLLVVRFGARTAWALALAAVLIPTAGTGAAFAALPALPRTTPATSPSTSPAPNVPESAQEITLGSLGLSAQVVDGGPGSVAVLMPPPAGEPAGTGSFVRIFFAHSPLLDPAGSSVTAAVNGQPLLSLRLDGSNADGSVFEARVAGSALHADRPNLLEARFELKLAGAPATGDSAAYARLEPQTLLHYQLYGPPGSRPPPRLESYPFPLVSRAGSSRVGLVLPHPSAEADLRVALRLAADLGRRAPTQQLQPEVVSTAAADWLRTAAIPALLVGTVGRVPQAESVLKAAGFKGSARGWTAPDGQPVGPADGLLVTVTSPFDGQSPVLLVSGFADEGLYRAAEAVVNSRGGSLAGPYAVVRRVAGAATPVDQARPGGRVSLGDLSAQTAQPGGDGVRLLTVPFTAPPVDPRGSGTVQLDLRGGDGASVRLRSVSLALNATTLTVGRAAADLQQGSIGHAFSGSLLRPGLNTVTIRLRLQGGGADPLSGATLTLPAAPPARPELELLPHPLFSDRGGVMVVVARLDDAVLSAAARGMAALGSRSQSTPSLQVVDAAHFDPASLGRSSVIAVGGSGGNRSLDRLNNQPATSRAPAAQAGGAMVQEHALGAPGSHFLLWLDGSSAGSLQSAASALYGHPLPGSAISFDAAGHPQAFGSDPPSPGFDPPWLLTLALPGLALAAAAALALVISWQLWRPLEQAP
ncbi:MAG TPA: cellulose biosynthesis cyclic di-GMP-binding regulatory protein BcsB [Candidatus Dormibacteraeota bacterium]